jgi:transcriptional regulator with XRE-family HTH domain
MRMAAIRRERKLSQRAAAALTGVPFATLGAWERGRGAPHMAGLQKLAIGYDVPISALTGIDDSGRALAMEWPAGLKEFITSEWAAEMELRPDEVEPLARNAQALGVPQQNRGWVALLVRIRAARDNPM